MKTIFDEIRENPLPIKNPSECASCDKPAVIGVLCLDHALEALTEKEQLTYLVILELAGAGKKIVWFRNSMFILGFKLKNEHYGFTFNPDSSAFEILEWGGLAKRHNKRRPYSDVGVTIPPKLDREAMKAKLRELLGVEQ
jgi:hypothetical protein